MQNTIPLESGKIFHLFNRGNNREDLFREDRNYDYFLGLYAKHVYPVVDTFAYCLMRNHFHLLVRIRHSPRSLDASAPSSNAGATQAFSNLFNAYAKAYNKLYRRSGSLFEERFHRIEVESEAYFIQLTAYIHRNPQRHGFVADFRDWPWTSYAAMCADQPTRIAREEVLGWFGGVEQFKAFHLEPRDESELSRFIGADQR